MELSKASLVDTTVQLSLTDGTADSTDYDNAVTVDYNSTQFYFDAALTSPIPGNTLTIPAGSAGPVDIYVSTINNDPPFDEPTENYTLQAEASGGATGIATANGLIEDQPVVIIKGTDPGLAGTTVEEGTAAKFTVELSKASAVDETVTLAATDGTADSSDYDNTKFYLDAGLTMEVPATGLVFLAGDTSIDIYVDTINNDPPFDEPNEDYTVTVTGTGGVEGTDTATGIITDSPQVTIMGTTAAGTTVEEGTAAKFTVELSKASAVDETVTLAATDGTADSSDYDNTKFYLDAGLTTEVPATGLVFLAGDTSIDIYVDTINNDPPFDEPNEDYTVTVTGTGGVEGTDTATGIITDSPQVTIIGTTAAGTTVEEGTAAKFTVELSKASAVDETVTLAATDGTADSSDYDNTKFYLDAGLTTEVPATGLVFLAGDTSIDIYVDTINNDPPFGEPTENYTVTVTGTGGVEGTDTATGFITDSHRAFVVGTNADDVGPDDNVDPHQVNNTPPIDSGTIIGGSNPDILVGDVGGTSATNTNANIILITGYIGEYGESDRF